VNRAGGQVIATRIGTYGLHYRDWEGRPVPEGGLRAVDWHYATRYLTVANNNRLSTGCVAGKTFALAGADPGDSSWR